MEHKHSENDVLILKCVIHNPRNYEMCTKIFQTGEGIIGVRAKPKRGSFNANDYGR